MQQLSGSLFYTLDINGIYQVFDSISYLEKENFKKLSQNFLSI